MSLSNPYEKEYRHDSILRGLIAYYNLLDKANPQVYTDKTFTISRADVQISIEYLKRIHDGDIERKLRYSHPILTEAIEGIEAFETLDKTELKYHEFRVILYLDNLLHSASSIMLYKYKTEINTNIKDLTINDKIEHAINYKHYFKQNSSSFPSPFVKNAIEYCEALIEQYKELKNSNQDKSVDAEVKEMVNQYQRLLENNINKNDLASPLVNNQFEEFINRFESMLFIPSYYDIHENDKERTFHVYCLAVLKGKLEGYNVFSNKESGLGRYDIALFPIDPRHPGVIIELKKYDPQMVIEDQLNEALAQIETKQYNFDLVNAGVESILYISILFKGLKPEIRFKSKV